MQESDLWLSICHIFLSYWTSLIAQLVKESAYNARDPGLIPGSGKILWRRDRLPMPVFLGFPHGSAGKESSHSVGDLGLIPGLGRSPGEGKGKRVPEKHLFLLY